jgi:hypothetical protein
VPEQHGPHRRLRHAERSDPAETDPSLAAAPFTEPSEPTPIAVRDRPRRTTVHAGLLLDGRYQLQQHISDRGADGDVQLWQGEDAVLARPVAIRLLIDPAPPTAGDPDGPVEDPAAELLAAARRAGQLVHNGAASTYDATTTDADGLRLAYVVSEWVTGISLLDLLRDGPLLPERSAAITLSVARVIAAAHALGITHGDLHPGDVVITSHGLIKVLDLEMRAAQGGLALDQRRDRDAESLGALLYACLTGRWPLGPGRGLPAAEHDPSGALRSPRQLRAGVPRELDALAMMALGQSVTNGPSSSHAHNGGLARSNGHAPGDGGPFLRAGSGAPLRPTAAAMVSALEAAVSDLPTGSQPALDDDPEAATPAAQSAKAAQAERLALITEQRRRTMRRRLFPIVLLVVLAVAAWLIGVAVDRIPHRSGTGATGNGQPSASATGSQLNLHSVTDFDPLGDGAENPSQVPLAYDGDLRTAWSTEQYYGSEWAGKLTKTGVGLAVDLGKPVDVTQVKLTFDEAGVVTELRWADSYSADPAAWTVAATSATDPAPEQTLRPKPGAHQYWLVWLTSLPRVSSDHGGTYMANLAEMAFYG